MGQQNSAPGKCIWKISKYQEQKMQAALGIDTWIYGPAFYTDPYGYKMCMKVCGT